MHLENDYSLSKHLTMDIILSTMVEGVLVLDKNSYIIRVNRAAENIFM